jgi:hypothetical protein
MPEEAIDPAEAALPSFVELLVPDPGKLPDLQVLFGFPGRSFDDDLVRLYQSLALDAYVEVRRQDVIHSQRLERVLPEATIMWLPRDARVVHGPPREPAPRDRG